MNAHLKKLIRKTVLDVLNFTFFSGKLSYVDTTRLQALNVGLKLVVD